MDWLCSRLVICSLVRVVWIDVDAMQCWTGLGENWSDELELMESQLIVTEDVGKKQLLQHKNRIIN